MSTTNSISHSLAVDSEVDGSATNLEGNKLDYQYWSNRAGTIAASQFPLIVALGTKNNVIGGKSDACSSNVVADSSVILCSYHGDQL